MLAYFFIFLDAVLRVVPHPANFAPIAATALFGGIYLNKRVALILPIAAMVISDFFIGFDSLQSRLVVYGSFLLIGLIGLLVRNRKNVWTILSGSMAGSVLFFLITNCVIFYSTKMYPHTIAGQIASYTNAIPFFRNTLVSDLVYTAAFCGIYEAVRYFHGYQSQSSNSLVAGKN